MLNTEKIAGYEQWNSYSPIYGARAWVALNLEAQTFATLPKLNWRVNT